MAMGGELFANCTDVVVQWLVLDGSVVDGKLVRGVFPVDADLLFSGDQHQLLASGHRIDGAAGDKSGNGKGGQLEKPAPGKGRALEEMIVHHNVNSLFTVIKVSGAGCG